MLVARMKMFAHETIHSMLLTQGDTILKTNELSAVYCV